jgi:hypothetical protein
MTVDSSEITLLSLRLFDQSAVDKAFDLIETPDPVTFDGMFKILT